MVLVIQILIKKLSYNLYNELRFVPTSLQGKLCKYLTSRFRALVSITTYFKLYNGEVKENVLQVICSSFTKVCK